MTVSADMWQARAAMCELLALSFRYPEDKVLAEAIASGEWGEAADEIAQRLLELEEKQDRLRYYVSLLKPRQAEVIRRTFFKPESQEETARALKISVRTVQTVKGQAINALVELYSFTEDLH